MFNSWRMLLQGVTIVCGLDGFSRGLDTFMGNRSLMSISYSRMREPSSREATFFSIPVVECTSGERCKAKLSATSEPGKITAQQDNLWYQNSRMGTVGKKILAWGAVWFETGEELCAVKE